MPIVQPYCRLSKFEIEATCQCGQKFAPDDPADTEFTCPSCGDKVGAGAIPNSIRSQIARIAEYISATIKGVEVSPVEWEICSASVDFGDRPVGRRVLNSLKRGDHLVVASLDRGWRSVVDFCLSTAFLLESEVNIHVIQERLGFSTPEQRAFGRMLVTFAQLEREKISERTKEGLRQRKRDGKPVNGSSPLGFDWVCRNCDRVLRTGTTCPGCNQPRREVAHLMPCRQEQEFMRFLLNHRRPSNWLIWDDIFELIKQHHYRNRQGRPYGQRAVYRMYNVAKELEKQGRLIY